MKRPTLLLLPSLAGCPLGEKFDREPHTPGSTETDADTDMDADTDADADTDTTPTTTIDDRWLHTDGNQILHADGSPFHGRGANLADTRGCWACAWQAADAGEVERRVDALVDDWGANFVRLDLQHDEYPQPYEVQWKGVLDDPAYLADVAAIVSHATAKDGVYVLLSEWNDPTFTSLGWPGPETRDEWALLAATFLDEPKVMFGLCNEPQSNFDHAQDPDVWDAMNDAVQTIRDVEDAAGKPHHLITVQGTGGWARYLDYYVTHPITAGGGDNIAYEVHVYDPQSEFGWMVVDPAATLPVIVGETGPSYMSYDDIDVLWDTTEGLGVPWLAWTFHQNCPPNLIEDTSVDGCGVGMELRPTDWGTRVQARLAVPW